MKMSTVKCYLHLLNAAAEGKTIQMKTSDGWTDFGPYEEIAFIAPPHCYRIKPDSVTCYAVVNLNGKVMETSEDKRYAQERAKRYLPAIMRVVKLVEAEE